VPSENRNPDARFLSKFKLYAVAHKERREVGLERRVQTDTEEYIKRHISLGGQSSREHLGLHLAGHYWRCQTSEVNTLTERFAQRIQTSAGAIYPSQQTIDVESHSKGLTLSHFHLPHRPPRHLDRSRFHGIVSRAASRSSTVFERGHRERYHFLSRKSFQTT
jgi:hypothetical protein